MSILTVATLKGGNAKTTTSLALAAVLAEKGHSVALGITRSCVTKRVSPLGRRVHEDVHHRNRPDPGAGRGATGVA